MWINIEEGLLLPSATAAAAAPTTASQSLNHVSIPPCCKSLDNFSVRRTATISLFATAATVQRSGLSHNPSPIRPVSQNPLLQSGRQIMSELVTLYAKQPAFYGWYFASEAFLSPYFTNDFLTYIKVGCFSPCFLFSFNLFFLHSSSFLAATILQPTAQNFDFTRLNSKFRFNENWAKNGTHRH
jgi:hypothetical protein